MEVLIRPVNYGYIVVYTEDDDQAEFVALTRKEAIEIANGLLHDYDQRINMEGIVTNQVAREK